MYGVDLAQWWRDRRWRGLLELIDQLPHASRFQEAVWNDREVVEQALDAQEGNATEGDEIASASVPLSEYSVLVERLTDIHDELKLLRATTVGVNGGKPGKITPAPRPVTMVDTIKRERAEAWSKRMADAFLPTRAN